VQQVSAPPAAAPAAAATHAPPAVAAAAAVQLTKSHPDMPLLLNCHPGSVLRQRRSLYESLLQLEGQGYCLVERHLAAATAGSSSSSSSVVDVVLSPAACLCVWHPGKLPQVGANKDEYFTRTVTLFTSPKLTHPIHNPLMLLPTSFSYQIIPHALPPICRTLQQRCSCLPQPLHSCPWPTSSCTLFYSCQSSSCRQCCRAAAYNKHTCNQHCHSHLIGTHTHSAMLYCSPLTSQTLLTICYLPLRMCRTLQQHCSCLPQLS
jgi:hypothetical protein